MKELLEFLTLLQKNPNKEWFNPRKDQYKQLKKEFERWLQDMAQRIANFDPHIKKALAADSDVVKVFRVYRDVRFSKNKDPLKTNMAGLISANLKDDTVPVYYVSIQSGGRSFLGGGLHLPQKDHLQIIRTKLLYNYESLDKIITSTKFTKTFSAGLSKQGMLKRGPAGFDIDHPAIEYLKRKDFVVGNTLSDALVQSKSLDKEVLHQFKVMYPMIDFFTST